MAGHPVVIADAGPLIALSRIARLDILQRLFDEVWITAEIRGEVLPSGDFPGTVLIAEGIEGGWIRVVQPPEGARPPINPGVDAGEASAIALADSMPGSLVIMDDRAGRAEAKSRGVAVIGTAAVVGLARECGLLESARHTLTALVGAGYFIPETTIEAVSRQVDD